MSIFKSILCNEKMRLNGEDKNNLVRSIYFIILFLLYMLICFFVPTFINGDIREFFVKNENTTVNENDIYNQDKIKLLMKENNVVIEMDFNDYLKGVLIGEMPVSYEIEALKAQAVVARTYTLYKLKNAPSKHLQGADMCDDINCCQAYKTKEYAFASWDDETENEKWAKFEKAVIETSGEVVLYNGQFINAFFHAHSGGKTENVKYLWSNEEIPYLLSVDGNESDMKNDSKTFSKEEFEKLINSKVPNYNNNSKILIENYTGSGRVDKVKIEDVTLNASELRSMLEIRSTNFRVEESGDNITFYTVGYGHGVGMSQEGANQMAKDGSNYIDIIKHYYTGVEISKINQKTNI